MGIKLVEEVLNYAPPDLTASERLLLVVIAQNANDVTRLGYPGMAVIAYRTGMKPESVQKTLKRLADKGIDLRVPLSKDKNGNVVYATSGRQTTYSVPNLPLSPDHRPPIKPSKGGPPSGLRADGGPDMGGPPSGLRADHRPPLLLNISSGSPQDLLKDQKHPPLASLGTPQGVHDDETEVVEAEIVPFNDPWARPRIVSTPSRFDDPWAS